MVFVRLSEAVMSCASCDAEAESDVDSFCLRFDIRSLRFFSWDVFRLRRMPVVVSGVIVGCFVICGN